LTNLKDTRAYDSHFIMRPKIQCQPRSLYDMARSKCRQPPHPLSKEACGCSKRSVSAGVLSLTPQMKLKTPPIFFFSSLDNRFKIRYTHQRCNPCGCSSMVEHQPSKLDTWVRFPSPAVCDSGVVGNARPCQGRDRGFEPRLSLFKKVFIFDRYKHFVRDSGVVGNARPCQGRDRGFEPRLSLSKKASAFCRGFFRTYYIYVRDQNGHGKFYTPLAPKTYSIRSSRSR
jgi:hypothetical protein